MFSLFLVIITLVSGCGGRSSGELGGFGGNSGSSEVSTAPSMNMEIQSNYKGTLRGTSSAFSKSLYTTQPIEAKAAIGESEISYAVQKYRQNIDSHNALGNAIAGTSGSIPDFTSISLWHTATTYNRPGNQIRFSQGSKHGVFVNKWWSQGEQPSFTPNYGPWEIIKRVDSLGNTLQIKDTIESWVSTVPYSGGNLVNHTISGTEYCFEAKYWTQNNEPILTGGSTGIAEWESPWKQSTKCDNTDDVITPINPIGGGKPPIEQPPVGKEPPDNTPIVPPVIPAPEPDPVLPAPVPQPILTEIVTATDCAGDGLPSDGYEFLRKVTCTHWDWMFPLRSGKYNTSGSNRNQPPFANPDGSTDAFTLANFKKAVLEYNAWAKSKGYKQFLNEGTRKQQAQEFLAFWGKACRETSGSWATANSPWIIDYTSTTTGETTKVWKGCLYWVEEVGYSTNSDGTSAALNYIDSGSSFTPAPNRSYYGRGVVQLSWNYNYGAFSAWLYANGLMTSLILSRDTLLYRPDYVATNGQLSILSAIWFWMTPQGAKPSSQDVMYGDVYNVSQTTQEQGLPQRNDDGNIPAIAGDTTDEAVMAYRFGTVINIVNGGLECNRAAKWHGGPPQRVSYFNAFTLYFNDQIPGLNATYLPNALDIWNTKISDSSSEVLKTSSCYSQKSYYGW